MRYLLGFFLGFLLCATDGWAQRPGSPIPPGEIQAAAAENQPLEPPIQPRIQAVAPQELKAQALALSKLAASIPAEIDEVTRGELPKQLYADLKKIEKDAKKLRGEVRR